MTASPAVEAQPALRLVGVSVRHDRRPILTVPELAVAPGEVLAVMGPNGAGKSTLLQVAAMLLQPDAGEVRLAGERVTRRTTPALRRRTAVVFQAPLLFDRSVLANVASGPRFRGMGRPEAEARAATWLTRFGIGHLAARNARALSGGEAQRTNLARAFATDPTLLLLDEPFAALDAPTRSVLVPELAELLRDTGVTAVVVTHDPTEAAALADRLAVMREGRIVQLGPIADVIARPADAMVAALVAPERLRPWTAARASAAAGAAAAASPRQATTARQR